MSKKNIYILIFIIIAMTFVFFVFNKKDEGVSLDQNGKIGLISKIKNFASENLPSKVPTKYINETYNFSFEFEKGVNVTSFKEGEEGDIVLVKQSGEKDSENLEFQIFISEFDEEGLITPNRIKQDLPNLLIKNPVNVIISKDQITALIFESESENESLGATREIWFVKNGFLYQITTELEMDPFVGPILETLKFN